MSQVGAIRQSLQSADIATRRITARQAHAASGEDVRKVHTLLLETLGSDSVWSVREAAAESIGRIAAQHANHFGYESHSVLLARSLSDSSEFVREMCRRELLRMDLYWPQTFETLDGVWQDERTHIRRRALQAFSDFSQKRDPSEQLAHAISDSHFKMRCTALIELRKHPGIFSSLTADVVRRCFDIHTSVALRASETIDLFRSTLPKVIATALEPARTEAGPRSVLSGLLQATPDDARLSFAGLCRERLAWHGRIGRKQPLKVTGSASLGQLIDACVSAAASSQQSERNAHRESAKLLGHLCALLNANGAVET